MDSTIIRYLEQAGRMDSYAAGDVICNRAPKPDLHVILEGEVEVRMQGKSDRFMPLSRLTAGMTFGEIALIQSRPGSSVVVAVTPCRILTYPGELFGKAIQECEPLRDYLLRRMTRNLQQTREAAWDFFRRTQAFHLLQNSGLNHGPLVAKSEKMRHLEARLKELGPLCNPVLFCGEPGTGKFLLATKLFELRTNPNTPLTVVDCRSVGDLSAADVLFGSGPTSSLAQLEYREAFGAIHLSHGGALLLRHIESLSIEAQELLEGYLSKQEVSPAPTFPKTRILATTDADLQALSKKGKFNPALAERLTHQSIRVPPVSERKKDILRLATYFLAQHGSGKRLTRDAGAALFARQYRHKNVSELKDTVLLAAHLSKGDEITEDQISIGPRDERSLLEIDLGKLPVVARLMEPDAVGTVRAITASAFVLLIGFAIWAARSEVGTLLNGIIWSVWEPILILSFIYLGRVWCAVCPLSLLGNLAKRFLALHRPHPDWFRKISAPVSVAGFVTIVLVEHFFEMSRRPMATAGFFLALGGIMVVLSVVYTRQVFCRWFCPLGALGSALAPSGALQLRTDPSICTTQCSTHDCFKGNTEVRGCPVFHHPLQMSEGDRCKLCLNCIRSCPHESTKIFFRPTLSGLWGSGQLNDLMAPFALSIFWFALLMTTLNHSVWRGQPLALIASSFGLALLGMVTHRFLDKRFDSEKREDPSIITRVSLALLILGSGPLLAYQLENIPLFMQLELHAEPGSWLSMHVLKGSHIHFVSVMQVVAIFFATGFCTQVVVSIRRRLKKAGVRTTRSSWAGLGVLALAYIATALVLLLSGRG